MTCSPFLLGGVINEHLKLWEPKYPDLVKKGRDGLYVDDLMTGVAAKRAQAIEVFKDGTFNLHKWYSNMASLEEMENAPKLSDDEQSSYVETKFGVNQHETKLLGLP